MNEQGFIATQPMAPTDSIALWQKRSLKSGPLYRRAYTFLDKRVGSAPTNYFLDSLHANIKTRAKDDIVGELLTTLVDASLTLFIGNIRVLKVPLTFSQFLDPSGYTFDICPLIKAGHYITVVVAWPDTTNLLSATCDLQITALVHKAANTNE